jgi:hypothetical protein
MGGYSRKKMNVFGYLAAYFLEFVDVVVPLGVVGALATTFLSYLLSDVVPKSFDPG